MNYLDMLDGYERTAIVFGDSAISQIETHLLVSETKCALCFLGGSSAERSGAWQAVLDALNKVEVNAPRHHGIAPEPDIACVEAMVKTLEKESPDTVIAIGGGSVMDAAKAAYLSWQSKMPVAELFGVKKASSKFPGRRFKRIVCVPTTAGTGSEVTPYSNIVDRERDVKMLIVEPETVPELAFVDPSLTFSAPPKLTLSVGLDALTHAVESFLNHRVEDKEADSWALEAIGLIVKGLPEALKEPHSPAARERLSAAATLAGMAIAAKPTGLPHLCSYSFFDTAPHGIVVASLLPYFWSFYLEEPKAKERTMLLKNVFPMDGQSSPDAIVKAYASFIASCGAPKAIGDMEGCGKELIDRIAKAAKENPVKLETAPKAISVGDSEKVLKAILKKAWRGEL